MSVSRIHSVAFLGLDALLVDVEVDAIPSDNPSFVIVGLPDSAVRESKDRVLAALRNAGFSYDHWRFTVNLAPGNLRKEGALYDLPIALGILQATGKLQNNISPYLVVGELGLTGDLRSIRGALPAALLARDRGFQGILLPKKNIQEASVVPNLASYGLSSLLEAIQVIQNPQKIFPIPPSSPAKDPTPYVDFSDIYGQEVPKRAVEIAASGGHNILLIGPPGTGKTLLAKALPSIMPPLEFEEVLEVTKIHSLAGIKEDSGLVQYRPFRSPHHTISYAGLMGGGSVPRPGEISLAHRGVLFLDELPEFSRTLLETLRQPLEDRSITISRAKGNLTFPASFLFVSAMNPCPCGMWGHPDRPCRDTELQRLRYRGKISEPLWDRIDMQIAVSPLRYTDREKLSQGESSSQVQQRVINSRKRQYDRWKSIKTNAQILGQQLRNEPLDDESKRLIRYAMEELHSSARGIDRLLRVARTIADLDNQDQIHSDHLLEALQYRDLTPTVATV